MREVLGPQIADRARVYVPKDTTALMQSIESHVDGTTLVVSATGSAEREYAAYIELGHRVFHPSTGRVGPEWVPARPFLRPALFGGFWSGPIGASMAERGSVAWKPYFGFGGDTRNSSSVHGGKWHRDNPGKPWSAGPPS
jgi:hypothetical protein